MTASGGTGAERRIGILTTDTELVVKSWDAALERDDRHFRAARRSASGWTALVPDLDDARSAGALLREPLLSGAVQVLAPALHKFLIPCAPARAVDRVRPHAAARRRRRAARRRSRRRPGGHDRGRHGAARTGAAAGAPAARRRRRPTALRAVAQLAALEPADGLGPLEPALADEDWQVRRTAVEALAGRRDAPLVDAVIAALRDGHRNFSLLSSALQLLSLTGVDVTDGADSLMQHPDADVRIQAALALGTPARTRGDRGADRRARRPRRQRPVSRDRGDRQAGAAGGDRSTGRRSPTSGDFFLAFPAIDGARPDRRSRWSAPRLAPLLDDRAARGDAAEALGQIGDEDAVAPLVAALERAGIRRSEPIVDALAGIHSATAELFSAAPPTSKIGSGSTISASGATADARRVAARAGGRAAASGGDARLAARSAPLPARWRGCSAAPSVQSRGDRGAGPVRRTGGRRAHRATAAATMWTRSALRSSRSAEWAIAARRRRWSRCSTRTSARCWVPAAGALARLGDARAFEALLALLGDPDAAVRQAAIGALNSIGHPRWAAASRRCSTTRSRWCASRRCKIAGYFGYADCADSAARALPGPATKRSAPRPSSICRTSTTHAIRRAGLGARQRHAAGPRGRGRRRWARRRRSGRARLAAGALVTDADPWVRYFAPSASAGRRDASALPLLERLAAARSGRFTSASPRSSAVGAIGARSDGAARSMLARSPKRRTRSAAGGGARARPVRSVRAVTACAEALPSGSPRPARRGRRSAGAPGDARGGRAAALDRGGRRRAGGGARRALPGSEIANRRPAWRRSGGARSRDCQRRRRSATPRRRGRGARPAAAGGDSPASANSLASREPRSGARSSRRSAGSRIPPPRPCLRRALADEDTVGATVAITALSRVGTRGLARGFADLARPIRPTACGRPPRPRCGACGSGRTVPRAAGGAMNCFTRRPRASAHRPAAAARSDPRAHRPVLRQRPLRHCWASVWRRWCSSAASDRFSTSTTC